MCAHVSSPSTHLTPYYEIRTCLRQGQGSLAHFSQKRGANTDLRVGVKMKIKLSFGYCPCSLYKTRAKPVAKLKKFEKVLFSMKITMNYKSHQSYRNSVGFHPSPWELSKKAGYSMEYPTTALLYSSESTTSDDFFHHCSFHGWLRLHSSGSNGNEQANVR